MVLFSANSVPRLRVVTVSLVHTMGRTQCGVLLSQLVVCPGYHFTFYQHFDLNSLERRDGIVGEYLQLIIVPNQTKHWTSARCCDQMHDVCFFFPTQGKAAEVDFSRNTAAIQQRLNYNMHI